MPPHAAARRRRAQGAARDLSADRGLRWLSHGVDRLDGARSGHTLRPTACAGVGASLLAAPTTSWGNNAFGKGPVGVAVRTGKAQSVADVGSDPIFAPWRNSAHAAG